MELEKYIKEFEDLEKKLSGSGISPDEIATLSKRHSYLTPLVSKIKKLKRVNRQITETENIIKGDDKELIQLAKSELEDLIQLKSITEKEIKILLIPPDPKDEKNTYLEIRPGAGGEEGSLFAADLMRAYLRFVENKGWKVEIMEYVTTGLKGCKYASVFIKGKNAYSCFKYEGGVHRVQRVPQTETGGRIHTSTCTVAVLPEVEDVEVTINPKDLRLDTFRASGAGGQHVNKVESAVRITHIPSQIVVKCQQERSQGKNKEHAMKMLKAKLAVLAEEESVGKVTDERRKQVGTADRSEKIRTYNYPQNRLTDHRLNKSWHNLAEIMEGNFDAVFEEVKKYYENLETQSINF